jgi:hypothetical protein
MPILALTATATAATAARVAAALGVQSCRLFSTSFHRPNLAHTVLPKTREPSAAHAQLAALIFGVGLGGAGPFLEGGDVACGLVYCYSKKDAAEVAARLEALALAALGPPPAGVVARFAVYHSEVGGAARRRAQADWMAGRVRVVVATTAFGMGVDRASVRFVANHTVPRSVEAYAQAAGRAGRDSAPAAVVTLASAFDVGRQRATIGDFEERSGEAPEARAVRAGLHAAAHASLAALQGLLEDGCPCRRRPQLAHFGETFTRCAALGPGAPRCDVCAAAAGRGAAQDATGAALVAVRAVTAACAGGQRWSLGLAEGVLLGARYRAALAARHKPGGAAFGALRDFGPAPFCPSALLPRRSGVERLLERLVVEGLLVERARYEPGARGKPFPVQWLEPAPGAAAALAAGERAVWLAAPLLRHDGPPSGLLPPAPRAAALRAAERAAAPAPAPAPAAAAGGAPPATVAEAMLVTGRGHGRHRNGDQARGGPQDQGVPARGAGGR